MTATEAPAERAGRGRPQLHTDEEVLDAALEAFARVGYEAMSIRSLGRDLGLSHGALNQRFGSKDKLFDAAVDHGFGQLASSMADHLAHMAPGGDDEVRDRIRSFILASAERPQIMRLMNTLGITSSARLDHVVERHISPLAAPLLQAVADRRGRQPEVSSRALFFLVAHGAPAPFTLRALSDHFDTVDGPLDVDAYADHMADVLTRALG